MAVTPTIQNTKPVVGGSADTWGGIVNDRIGETYVDINALATQGNASEAAVVGKVSKAGDTMTGDLKLANVAPTDTYSAGFLGAPPVNFDADKTLVLAEAGRTVRLTGTTARVLTIPPASSVGFPIGTVIPLRNFSTAALTIARGAAVQLRLPGSGTDANRTLASYGFASLVHEDTNVWILSGVGAS